VGNLGAGPTGMDWGISASMPLPIGTAQPAPHKLRDTGHDFHTDLRGGGMEEDRPPNTKASSGKLGRSFPQAICSWALTDVKSCTVRVCPMFIPEASHNWREKKKAGITQIFQTHICTLCTFHAQ